jgi:DNA-binding MarR family transcriptional regulator
MRKVIRRPKRLLWNFSIGELERFHEVYHWARDRVLKKEGLRHVHLAMLRWARIEVTVALSDLRQLTGFSMSAMNKHRDALAAARLIKPVTLKTDKRQAYFSCTDRGKSKLEEIDAAIESEVIAALHLRDRSELETLAFDLFTAMERLPGKRESRRLNYEVPADWEPVDKHLYVQWADKKQST